MRYCINGMIVQTAVLLTHNPKPTEQQIKAEPANNLCRCGTHLRIMRAVKRATRI
jgi:nicotinate dehydrogenase subunit A